MIGFNGMRISLNYRFMLKLAGNGLEVGSHDCVRRKNDRWWRGYECVLRECLNGSKHFSRNLEARR
jgi:hypothetical protein